MDDRGPGAWQPWRRKRDGEHPSGYASGAGPAGRARAAGRTELYQASIRGRAEASANGRLPRVTW